MPTSSTCTASRGSASKEAVKPANQKGVIVDEPVVFLIVRPELHTICPCWSVEVLHTHTELVHRVAVADWQR